MKLYELTGEYLRLLDMAEDETIDAETLADTMEGLQGEIAAKVDAYSAIIQTMKNNAEALDKEQARLADRAVAYRNKSESIKKALENAMRAMGENKIKTEHYTAYIRKNAASVDLDAIEPELLPERFKRTTVKIEADKKAIRAALENGEQLEYARLKQSESLIIK